MIIFDDVTFTYAGAKHPTLEKVNLEIVEGELALVLGETGSGKSTFLRLMNGLVPHFTGGNLRGSVIMNGRDTATHPPRELADLIGMVPQDPLASFVSDTVEEELAYTMECLGVDGAAMRKRVEETLDLLGITSLRRRPVTTLSGGERQRVAIGAVMTAHPKILILDEPTSALDPGAAEEVLATLQRLVHDLGVTVVIAEHRLERVIEYADQIIALERREPQTSAHILQGKPVGIMRDSTLAPPVVRLGRLVNWNPLPLSIRDARRSAAGLRSLLSGKSPHVRSVPNEPKVAARIQAGVVVYGPAIALRNVDFELYSGTITALMGRNGAGKSTLLNSIVGLVQLSGGVVHVDGVDPPTTSASKLMRHVGLVPQEPADLLEAVTVADECRTADSDSGSEPGTCRAVLALLAPEITNETHPRDLSEGQRLLLALSIVLAARPQVVLLDEPTRGLDYPTKARLCAILRDLADNGHAVALATHDVELVAETADRVAMLADGELVAQGPTSDVITSSPLFSPQVTKVVAPEPFLTVEAVDRALQTESETV